MGSGSPGQEVAEALPMGPAQGLCSEVLIGRPASFGLGGAVIGHGLRAHLRFNATQIDIDLVRDLGLVPAEDRGEQRRRVGRGSNTAIALLDRHARATSEHIGQVQGPLLRGGIHHLDLEVTLCARQGLAQRGFERRPGEQAGTA